MLLEYFVAGVAAIVLVAGMVLLYYIRKELKAIDSRAKERKEHWQRMMSDDAYRDSYICGRLSKWRPEKQNPQ